MQFFGRARVCEAVDRRDAPDARRHLLELLQPLPDRLRREVAEPRHVAARPRKALHEPAADRVAHPGKDNGNGRGGLLRGGCARAGGQRDEHVNLLSDKLLGEGWQALVLRAGAAPYEGDSLPVHVPERLHSLDEHFCRWVRRDRAFIGDRAVAAEHADLPAGFGGCAANGNAEQTASRLAPARISVIRIGSAGRARASRLPGASLRRV